jgi:predicted ArsR family transcriptional regulator
VAKRRNIGRPHYVFSLTEQGEDLFPRSYVQLANRIIEELVSLSPEETGGKGGVALAGTLFEKMAEHVAQTYAGRISGRTLKERISEVVALLANEGMFFEARKAKSGYLLVGQGCPCPRIANAHSEVCVHDQRLLARLLDAEVQPAGVSEDDVRSCCAYTVKEKTSAGS